MQKIHARYTPEAANTIRKIHPQVKAHIKAAIDILCKNPFLGYALQFELSGYCSYRVKNYRVIYKYNERSAFLEVFFVGARKDVYENFRELLLKKNL